MRTLGRLYFTFRIARPNDDYWTIGIQFPAQNFDEAGKLIQAFQAGVSLCGYEAVYQDVCSQPEQGRTYHELGDMSALAAKLHSFLHPVLEKGQ